MQIYEQPKMGIAMFHKENVAVTGSTVVQPTAPPTIVDPNNPGGGGIQMPDAVNINDI